MRKLRLVKVVVPDIVAYMGEGPGIENMEPEWCPLIVEEEGETWEEH